MRCAYCSTPIEDSAQSCWRCGGPIEKKKYETEKESPFFFRGFMIWPTRDWSRDLFEYHIWLGERHIGSFTITRRQEQAYHAEFGDGVDVTSLLDRCLRLAIGETEVEKWEQINPPRQLVFEMRQSNSQEWEDARFAIRELMG